MTAHHTNEAAHEEVATDVDTDDRTAPESEDSLFERFGPPTPTREDVIEAMLSANTQVDIERDLGISTEATRKLVYALRKAGHDADVNCTIYTPLDRATVETAVAEFADDAPVTLPSEKATSVAEVSDAPTVTRGMRRPAAIRVLGEAQPFGIQKNSPEVDLDAVPDRPPAGATTSTPATEQDDTLTATDRSASDLLAAQFDELNRSQVGLLWALSRRQATDKRCVGIDILEEYGARVGEEIPPARGYNNLRLLVDDDYVEKTEVNGRMNSYSVTEKTIATLVEDLATNLSTLLDLDSVSDEQRATLTAALSGDNQ